MKAIIFLHSTTGNTRLVTRYAAKVLEGSGYEVTLHDIVAKKEPPAIIDHDLVGVAFPTMYFRATFAMERFVTKLPVAEQRTPAFLLTTCAGEPGAAFSMLAELLDYKDITAFSTHMMLSPSNWPTHFRMIRPLAPLAPVGDLLVGGWRPLKLLAASLWKDRGQVDVDDRAALDEYLQDMLRGVRTGAWHDPPIPQALYRNLIPGSDMLGRKTSMRFAAKGVDIRIDAERCSHCGVCVKICPMGTITQSSKDVAPVVGDDCSGCWACYNHCKDGAIAGIGAPVGGDRYLGPSKEAKRIFSTK